MCAVLLALGLAALSAVLAGPLLRWCPVPTEAWTDTDPDLIAANFGALLGPRFRWTVFIASLSAGALAFAVLPGHLWAVWAPLVVLGPVLAVVDLQTTFLPSRIVYLGIALALLGASWAAWAQASWQPLLNAVGGSLSATAFFWLLWRLSGGQLGFGDVRLAGFIGMACGTSGPQAVWQALLLGTLVGAAWGLITRWRRGSDGAFPYGPALLFGPGLWLLLSWLSRLW